MVRHFLTTRAQTTQQPPPKPAEKPWQYSKEFLLSFFQPQLDLASDMDLSLGATTEETLLPMANLPLSDLEKRVLHFL